MADLTLDDLVTVPEAVLSRELQGETVLLNLDTGVYFGLDEVGTAMWRALRDGGRIRAAIDALLPAYDVERATLEADLLQLADTMLARGLIVRRDGGGASNPGTSAG
jgi:hypothetical protein